MQGLFGSANQVLQTNLPDVGGFLMEYLHRPVSRALISSTDRFTRTEGYDEHYPQ